MDDNPQDLCLVNEPGAGANYMGLFDTLPPPVREKLRTSSFNLCCMCLLDYCSNHGSYYLAIEEMEKLARQQHGA